MKRSRGCYYYVLLGEDKIHAGLSKDEATSFMHTYHKIWEAGQESVREKNNINEDKLAKRIRILQNECE